MSRIDLKSCTINLRDGLAGTADAANTANEKQTVTLTAATGGTFTLTSTTETTAIAFDATANAVQLALAALVSVGTGNVSVTGSAGGPYTVEFIGTLAGAHRADMTYNKTSLTGEGNGIAIVSTQTGGSATAPLQGGTVLKLATTVLNTDDTDKVPVGARFTIAGETTATTVHTVTARTPASTGPTTAITFSPALGAGSYATDAVLTFGAQQLAIKVGDGDLKFTEASQYKYDLDRGLLDTVRAGDETPMEISLNFTWDQVKSGTSEVITPIEALKGIGAGAEWVTSATDTCEPYAVDLEVIDDRPCGTVKARTYLFPDFRSEKRDYAFKDAAISINGKCLATEPTITVET